MTVFLGIETSCDETAAAVFDEALVVRSSIVASQAALHERFTGVVPEIAARAHLRNLLPVIDEALRQAEVPPSRIGAIAVHNSPGLVGSLLMGVSAAKMLAIAWEVPLIAVDHVASHIFACRMAAGRDIFPCIGLVVSGGHTSLFECNDPLSMRQVGATRDDAAGEAFDKVAALLKLGFPGGPAVERVAKSGNPKAYAFPRSLLNDERLDFSFSGLKTAVLYALHGQNRTASSEPPSPQQVADLAASFQAAVTDILVGKCRQALRRSGFSRLAVGGGVSANRHLRQALERMCAEEHVDLFIPPLAYCTDNAAMAALAVEKWRRGEFAGLDLDAEPNRRGASRATSPPESGPAPH